MSLGLNGGVANPQNYVRTAIDRECEAAASTAHGRNEQLNRSAFAVGRFVGAGVFDRAEAEHRLEDAARACGYVGKDGIAAARATIKSGLEKGIRDPRDIPSSNGHHASSSVEVPKGAAAQLKGVGIPDWTQPEQNGTPKFFAIGRDLPPEYDTDLRRHIYRRDGQAIRVKVKKETGTPPWVNNYKVRRPSDGAIGWQAKQPPGFVPTPYVSPNAKHDPFETSRRRDVLVWAEGEKDVDTLAAQGFNAFTFGGSEDVPDCTDLLRDRDLIVTGDNDKSGEKGIKRRIAMAMPVAASVRVVRFHDFPIGGDATDFFEKGGTAEGFLDRAQTAEATDTKNTGPADPVTALVERFNSKYMVVNEAGKAIVLQPGYDPALRRRRYDRITVRDLQTLYMNEVVEVGKDDKDRAVIKPVADVWLKHPDRRQFINGITFDPTAAQQDGVLNLWEGYAVTPAPSDWSLMRAHILDVICDGDPIRFDYLMGWMARLLQHPAEQGEVAVVMKGGEGTGKGTLARALLRITGHHGLAISNAKHLVGNFNAHLRDVVFLFADEAFFAGDRSHVGVLKSLITEPCITVEGKFQNAIQAPNYLHLMMASNEEWVVPASLDARRFFVLEVPNTAQGDHSYFSKIWAQMEAGGYGGMLHELLDHDLTSFNVRAVPTTEGLQQQRRLSLPTTESWWLDCLERGYVFRSKIGLHDEFGCWHETAATELLFASYMEFAQARHERRPVTREHLGKFLAGLGAKATRPNCGIVGEQVTDVRNDFGGTSRKAMPIKRDRPPSYHFGSLMDARSDFSAALKINLPWDTHYEDDSSEEPSGSTGFRQGDDF